MDTKTPDNAQNVCPPPDDGAIKRALADLDTQLAAWSATVRQAQERLTKSAGAAGPADATADSAEVDSGQPGAERGTARTAEHQISEPAPRHATAPPEVTGPPPRTVAAGTTGSPAAQFQGGRRAAGPTPPNSEITGRATGLSGSPGLAPGPPRHAESKEQEEDVQALLASLDEQTARRVRLLQRLGTGEKSVRELIKECQAADSAHSLANPQKKSWWTRGR